METAGAELPIDVALSLNGSRAATLNSDQPAIIFVSMMNYEATAASLNNKSVKVRIDAIRRKAREEGTDREELKRMLEEASAAMRPVRVFRFGGAEGWGGFLKIEVKSGRLWAALPWSTHTLSLYPAASVAVLDGEHAVSAELGIDPEDVGKIAKGTYELRVSLEIVQGTPTRSNVATVEFTGTETPAETKSTEDYLYALADYYLMRGPPERAKRFVQEALKVHPRYSRLTVMMGDILEQEGDLKGALGLYESALDEYEKKEHGIMEEPDALYSRIGRVQERLYGGPRSGPGGG